jgi:integrase
MASIEKRPGRPNPWQARYRAPNGKQHAQQFARKVDAERFLATVESDKLRGAWTDPRLGKTTFVDWAEQWWETTATLRLSSRLRVRGILDRYLLPTFGPRALASITHLEVRVWVAQLSASGLAPRTVRKVAQTFAKIYSAAVDARLVGVSPCERVPLPDAEHDEMRFITPAEVKTLADVIDPRYRALVLVGAYGGLRLGELVGLRRRRVDLLRGRIEVAETGVEVGVVVQFRSAEDPCRASHHYSRQ